MSCCKGMAYKIQYNLNKISMHIVYVYFEKMNMVKDYPLYIFTNTSLKRNKAAFLF